MSMMKAALLGAMIPLALAAPSYAQGQGGHDGPRMIFEDLDANGDGAVTLEEMQAQGAARFARADADGDGFLTAEELTAAAQERMASRVERMIERADSDGDGQLTQEELAEARDGRRGPNPERIFARMDADDDGQVTEAEFDEAVARFLERRGSGRWFGGGHRGDRG